MFLKKLCDTEHISSYFILKFAVLFINGTFLPARSAVTSIHASSNASIVRINHCIPVINGAIPVNPAIAVAVARLFDWNKVFVLT